VFAGAADGILVEREPLYLEAPTNTAIRGTMLDGRQTSISTYALHRTVIVDVTEVPKFSSKRALT
jgi:hypothetical protein